MQAPTEQELAEKQRVALEQARAINKAQKNKSSSRLIADHVDTSLRGLSGVQPVAVVEIQLRFWSMVRFMVMWSLASIPAVFILSAVIYGILLLFGAAPR